jgi:hypothetical protein
MLTVHLGKHASMVASRCLDLASMNLLMLQPGSQDIANLNHSSPQLPGSGMHPWHVCALSCAARVDAEATWVVPNWP